MSDTATVTKFRRETSASDRDLTILLPGERLKKGIWPKSVALWMAGFYVGLFIIRPWEQLMPSLGDVYFEKVYALCMIAVVLLSGRIQIRINLQTITVIFFFLAVSLSAVFARSSTLAWDVLYEYLTLVIFFFILMLVIRTPYELVFMVTCYIVALAVYLAKSQWEFFAHGQHRYDMGVVRLCGIESTFGGPNNLAMSVVVSLPMLLFLWSIRKEFTCEWPQLWHKWFPRFLVFYAVLAVSSIILTNSRSGMVSFILFVALTTFRGKGIGKKISYILLGIVVLAMLWLVMPEEKKDRFRTIWTPEEGPKTAQVSAEGRIEGYKAGMKMFERFPLTGVGIGNFINYRVSQVDGVPLNAHNLAGQVLGETGMIGASAFLFMVIVTLANCQKVKGLVRGNRSYPKLKALSSLGLASRDALILLAFEGLFGHNLLRFNWLWLAAFSSLALQFARMNTKRKILKNDHSQAVS
jgi:O-antigen ligase